MTTCVSKSKVYVRINFVIMGKLRKRFNKKGRQQVETVINRSEEKKIKLDIAKEDGYKVYDDCNTLVLPSKKRKTKKITINENNKKILTKKMKKKLMKILEKKEKKRKRANLLEELMAVQASSEELAILASNYKKKKQKKMKAISEDESQNEDLRGKKTDKSKEEIVEEAAGAEMSDDSVHTTDMSSDEENKETANDITVNNLKDSTDSDPIQNAAPDSNSPGIEEESKSTKRKLGQENETKESNELTDDKKRKITEQKSGENIEKTNKKDKVKSKPVTFIPVHRKPEMQEARLKLPILGEEQQIMESINENRVVIIVGDTGSGKTTQVPQFLYEAGYAQDGKLIGITEPRRVAAISMSNRVGSEMNLSSSVVSYQIRYEGNTSSETKIKFMTDGVLFKEVQQDFLLTKYSVIILDEAHERTVYTDILIGLLSRIVPIREKKGNPLKLVIMSATLRLEDFTDNPNLFKITPPIVKVDSRQYPVTIHFNKFTPVEDYLGEVYKKTCKIHTQLPEGGILIFVTSQQEVHTLCHRLRQRFPFHSNLTDTATASSQIKHSKKSSHKRKQEKEKVQLPDIKLDDYSIYPENKNIELADDDDDVDLSDGFEDKDDIELEKKFGNGPMEPLYVLPLYSLLPGDKQAKVFQPPPPNCRLCVVATNVAETSLTIPNVKYVVDCGKVKTKYCDKVTGASTFKVTWTSKASASQRAGRAGRIGPGHCYRLYSSAVYIDFEEFSLPEILRRPIDDIVLQMRFLGIDKVINFPFPTSPDKKQLLAAEKLLVSLGALSKADIPKSFKESKNVVTKLTNIGQSMATLPVSPRYAKMLVFARQHGLMPYAIAMVAALSVQELFLPIKKSQNGSGNRTNQDFAAIARGLWSGSGHSLLLGDPMLLLKGVGACEFDGNVDQFCDKFCIRTKGMKEVRKLRLQLTNTINLAVPGINLCIDPKMEPPTESHAKLLRQIVLAGLADHVARRIDILPEDCTEEKKKQLKYAYETLETSDPVWIHPDSVLYKKRPKYVAYQHIHETSKPFMKVVAGIEPEWFPLILPNMCTFSKPEEKPAPRYDSQKGKVICYMGGTFGPQSWPFTPMEMEYPSGIDCYRWFAKFLLEGLVCPKLKKFVPHLSEPPCIMIKFWSKLKPQTEVLLKPLLAANITTKKSLLKQWTKDDTFLLFEYSRWLPKEHHPELKKQWPPV